MDKWAYILAIFTVGIVQAARAESLEIAHFESPLYPPLARQALISGQVALEVSVDKNGTVTSALENKSAHPFLAQWAKECLVEWKFRPGTERRSLAVVFYYGFSGTTRETNPRTSVKADFYGSSIRVFITTDPVSPVHP